MTPSGVSRAVARLETRLGVRLFDRNPRSVALTEEGRQFHAQVLPLLTSLEEAATQVAGASTTIGGRLRINVDPWFSRMVLAPRLRQFLGRYPSLSVEVGVSNYREEMMTGVDVAVRFGPTEPSSLIARKLVETRVLTCAAPAYLKQHGEPLMPQDLIQHETVLFRDPQTGRPFPWEFHRKGKVVDVQVRGRMVTASVNGDSGLCVGLWRVPELRAGSESLAAHRQACADPVRLERRALSAIRLLRFASPAASEDPGIPGFRAGNHRGGRPPVRRARQSLRQSLHGHQFRMTGGVCLGARPHCPMSLHRLRPLHAARGVGFPEWALQ